MFFNRISWLPGVKSLILVWLLAVSCGESSNLQPPVLSDEKRVLDLTFAECAVTIDIRESADTILAYVPNGTVTTSLTPTFDLSAGSEILPASNVTYDFSTPTTYEVTAEDGSTRRYTVVVLVREGTALLVIDMQNAIFPVFDEDRLLDNVVSLISKAESEDVPIVYLQFNDNGSFRSGSYGWQFHIRLNPRTEDVIVQKWYQDSFQETRLENVLLSRLVGRVVIVGLQSQYCVRETGYGALRRHYSVVLVEDAHSTNEADAASVISSVNSSLENSGAVVVPTLQVSFSN